jgi:hypothetical protein
MKASENVDDNCWRVSAGADGRKLLDEVRALIKQYEK